MSADTPQPVPSHIPWYQSQTLRALALSALSQLISFAVAQHWLNFTPDANTIVTAVFELGAGVGVLWAAIIRTVKPMPVIVASKAKAEAMSNSPLNAPKVAPNVVKLHWATFLLLLLIFPLLIVGGCANQLGVVAGQTPEQKAAGLLGDFTVYQSASLKIGTDNTVPGPVRQRVLQTAIDAKPLADSLDVALRDYRMIEKQLKAGTTTQDKVNIAATQLVNWIAQLQPLVTSLRSQVEAIAL